MGFITLNEIQILCGLCSACSHKKANSLHNYHFGVLNKRKIFVRFTTKTSILIVRAKVTYVITRKPISRAAADTAATEPRKDKAL